MAARRGPRRGGPAWHRGCGRGGREDKDAKAGEDDNGQVQAISGAENEMGNILRVAGGKKVYWAFHHSDGLVWLP